MADFEKYNDEIWVFLSHSNKDFDKVRILRNKMEERGMRPLMFFLKCLDSAPETFELLKREIDVRPRFFLCDSKNSRSSEWVQREVEYIKSKNRQFITVDLDDMESLDKKIQEMISRSQVYFSYSRKDYPIVEKLSEALQKLGFRVLELENLLSYNFERALINIIEEACENGYVIYIISKNSGRSEWIKREIDHTIRMGGYVIPVVIDYAWEELHQSAVSHLNAINIDTCNLEESINDFCDRMLQIDRQRNK